MYLFGVHAAVGYLPETTKLKVSDSVSCCYCPLPTLCMRSTTGGAFHSGLSAPSGAAKLQRALLDSPKKPVAWPKWRRVFVDRFVVARCQRMRSRKGIAWRVSGSDCSLPWSREREICQRRRFTVCANAVSHCWCWCVVAAT